MAKQEKLIQKVQTEFVQFRWEVMKGTKQQIFDKAYEIASKEDIQGFIESEELAPKQLDILLDKDNSLDFLYMCWLMADKYHVEDINNCLKYACGYEKDSNIEFVDVQDDDYVEYADEQDDEYVEYADDQDDDNVEYADDQDDENDGEDELER